MSVVLSPIGGFSQQFCDANGDPLAGGKLYSYAAGTTTPLSTAADYTGLTNNTNPIILGSDGRVGQVWLGTGLSYKFVLKTSADVLVATWDNCPTGNQAVTTAIAGDSLVGGTVVPTGVYTLLTADRITLDRGSEWDPITNQFNCAVPGDYFVEATVELGASTPDLVIVKNGVIYDRTRKIVTVTGGIGQVYNSVLIPLTLGDNISFKALQASGADKTAHMAFSIFVV